MATAMTETPANRARKSGRTRTFKQPRNERRDQQRADDRRAGCEIEAGCERDRPAQRKDADDERGQQAVDPGATARLPFAHDLDLEPVEVDHPAHVVSLSFNRRRAVTSRCSWIALARLMRQPAWRPCLHRIAATG